MSQTFSGSVVEKHSERDGLDMAAALRQITRQSPPPAARETGVRSGELGTAVPEQLRYAHTAPTRSKGKGVGRQRRTRQGGLSGVRVPSLSVKHAIPEETQVKCGCRAEPLALAGGHEACPHRPRAAVPPASGCHRVLNPETSPSASNAGTVRGLRSKSRVGEQRAVGLE